MDSKKYWDVSVGEARKLLLGNVIWKSMIRLERKTSSDRLPLKLGNTGGRLFRCRLSLDELMLHE